VYPHDAKEDVNPKGPSPATYFLQGLLLCIPRIANVRFVQLSKYVQNKFLLMLCEV
jgi:hypothetical protein